MNERQRAILAELSKRRDSMSPQQVAILDELERRSAPAPAQGDWAASQARIRADLQAAGGMPDAGLDERVAQVNAGNRDEAYASLPRAAQGFKENVVPAVAGGLANIGRGLMAIPAIAADIASTPYPQIAGREGVSGQLPPSLQPRTLSSLITGPPEDPPRLPQFTVTAKAMQLADARAEMDETAWGVPENVITDTQRAVGETIVDATDAAFGVGGVIKNSARRVAAEAAEEAAKEAAERGAREAAEQAARQVPMAAAPELPPVTAAPEVAVAAQAVDAAPKPKLDPIARKQVSQFVKKNNITDRALKQELFSNGLTPDQKATLIKKPLPPVREVGLSRFTVTAPDKMRESLGQSGFKAWRMLDERNFVHETRQIRDERMVKALTKGWSEQDHVDAFDYVQRARYPMDPAREAAMRPEVKAAAEKVAALFKRQADDMIAVGAKVPVDTDSGRAMMEFVPIEQGYAPWYRRGDVDAPGLPQGRFRNPDANRSRLMARDEAIDPAELDRHLGRAALRYFDETNEIVATNKVFGNEPYKAIDAIKDEAIAEGKDGFYIREALDLALNGGPTKSNYERKLVQTLSQITVNLTLPFSGPAQLSQLSMAATKGGVKNLLHGMGRVLKSITDANLRDEIVKSGATFESVSRGLHEGRKASGILGKSSALTLNSPIGVTPWDKFARYVSGAMGRPYSDDLARVVRGEKVAWYNDLKLSPEVAARELAQAGIDPKRIASGQPLTPDDYDRITRRFSLDANLGQRPEDHAIIFQRSPFERLRGILLRFGMQQFPQFRREVIRPLTQQGRVAPAARWVAGTTGAGYLNKQWGDFVYNRDTDDETMADVAVESLVAGAFGIYYQLALATKYGFDSVFAGAALSKVGDVLDSAGQYAWGVQEGARDAINEGDPAYLTEALREPVDQAMEGKGPLIRLAKIHPAVNATARHLEDPDRSPLVP